MIETVKLGVDWDKPTQRVLNAILRDALIYSRLLPPNAHLTIVSPNPNLFVGSDRVPRDDVGLYDFGGIRFALEKKDDATTCDVWKLYYEVKRPAIPSGAKQVYYSRVGNNGVKRIILRKDDTRYPSLENPSDQRVVPPGRSPNINKIPIRYSGNGPSMIYRLM